MEPMFEKPYPRPITDERVVARFEFARSASFYLADIEAYLVEQELPVSLAEDVARLCDSSGWSIPYAVAQIKDVLDPRHVWPEPPTP